jgi:hypothetical protein
MKLLILTFAFLLAGFNGCNKSYATGLADLKFGQSQIADSQWNVSACTQTATCQIYSTNPGTAYKIPWTSGQIQWAAGDYIQFQPYTTDANNPWLAVQYGSNGVGKTNMGLGHIINMGNDYFFFVGSDNDTGQLFSMTSGLSSSAGMSWTGTLNPTAAQVDAYAANGSTTPLAAGQTAAPPGPPPLCCGGSSQPFSANSTYVTSIQNFHSRATNDSKVYVNQVGSFNSTIIEQTGTKDNYASYVSTGDNNNVTINQHSNNPNSLNYTDLHVLGNQNAVNITQQSTGGMKGAFVTVNDNNNSITLQQKDSGNHWADIMVSGNGKTVDILQQGSAGHMASVQLTGPQPASLNLQQSGSTQQFYAIQSNCTTVGGCAPITVQQGK